ncbi:MAG: nucleoside hydrolase [Steroidobacteraceae bacterium]
MTVTRRSVLAGAVALLASARFRGAAAGDAGGHLPRLRVILDNDFGGDPDGLFQAAHHLLSPSVDVRLVIGSHLHAGEFFDATDRQATHAAETVTQLIDILGLERRPRILAGAEAALAGAGVALAGTAGDPARASVARTSAAEAIIDEALHGDPDLPLYYCAGAGLTDLATAWLLEPRIGPRVRLAWIGGPEYPGTPAPPGPREAEYNLTIDPIAAQVIFNRSDIDIWQVPRSTYRQMLVGRAELERSLRPAGRLGEYLLARIDSLRRMAEQAPPPHRMNLGETYALGDSPLVTLTALQSAFQPEPASSRYETRARPSITPQGGYGPPVRGRTVRVYTHIDTRLTFEDMYAKFAGAATQP